MKMRYNNKQIDIPKQAAKIVQDQLGNDYKVFLFGSRARGIARYNSDYDIGIFGNNKISLSNLFRIKNKLNNLPTLASIDVVDFKSVPKDFYERAIIDAQRIV